MRRCARRARRYRRIATRNFGTFCRPYWLWVWRSKFAAMGFGPRQLHGKTASDLFRSLYSLSYQEPPR